MNVLSNLLGIMNNRKGLLILCLSLATFGVESAWGTKTTDYYSKATVSANPSGGGKVYVAYDSSTKPASPNSEDKKEKDSQENAPEHTYHFWADVNSGYSWSGWTFTNGNPNSSSTQSNATSKIIANEKVDKATITATATFTAHTYKVNFDGNGATGGSMNQQTLIYDQTSLDTNAFTRSYTVNFDADGGSAADTKTATYTFNNWNTKADGTGTTYSNQQKNLTTEDNATINLYAQWNSASITLPSSEKSGYVLDGWFSGDTKIGNPGDNYVPTSNVTLKAHWTGKYNPEFSYAGSMSYNVGDGPIDLQQLWISTGDGAITYTKTSFTPASGQQSGSTEPAITNNRYLSLGKAGTLTIHLEQDSTDAYYAGRADVTITISRIANTLTVDATHSMYVDDVWTSVISGKISDATITTTTTDGTVAYYDVANNKIVAQNTNSQSFNSKEVTITISQAETYKYTVVEKTIKVTANKWDNTLYINGTENSLSHSMFVDEKWGISLTATNTDYAGSPITATPNNDVTTINDAKTQVSSNYKIGTTTWTISQPENYKYKAANATLTVMVEKQAEETCYVLEHKEEGILNTIQTGEWIKINGPANILTFEAWRSSNISGTSYLYLDYAKDNDTGNPIEVSLTNLPSETYTPFKISLPISTTHIRFRSITGATLQRKYRNILVTRATYLEPNDISITQTKSGNDIHPNEVGVGNLNISYSFATNSGDTKIVWDNDNFTINGKSASEGVNLGDLGCSNGTIKYDIEYKSIHAIDADVAHVTIYNKVWNETFTITGKTVKRDQVIQWNTDVMIVGQTEAAAARTTAKIINPIITYTSDSSEIIRVNNDANGLPTILEAVHPGTVKITAFSKGNGEYNDASDTKEITVTDKDIQFIVWNQSLMGLKMGDSNVHLNASASEPDSLNCQYPGQRPITYQSMNESIVQIEEGNQLKIVGVGVTSVIASQAGGTDQDGHDFIAVTAEKKVVVLDPNAPCETYIYEQASEVSFDLGWNAANHKTKDYVIDFNGIEPRTFNFDYKGKIHTVWPVDYYAGELIVEQYVNNQWVRVNNFGKPGTNNYTNTGDWELNRNATKMRVIASNGMGYMYFKDCQITLARYLEGSSLNVFETKVGSPVQQTLTVSYSNISGPLTFSLPENSKFSIDKTSHEGVCGDKDATTIVITYTPTEAATNDEATLTLSDGNQKTYITLKGKASVTPLHIEWDIPDNNACYTIDQVSLSAKAFTDLSVEVPNYVWFSILPQSTTGTLTNGNILSFNKAGSVTIAANTQTGDAGFSQAPTITKTWTVSKTPTQVTTKPTISAPIVSGTSLSDIVLEGGAAQNTVNNQAVEGTFAVTSGETTAIGEQTLTVTFTPNNTDMYEGCTTTITANVVQREATAEEIGTPSAAPITYGSVINTSALSGNGTLGGEWAWVDEDANKATPNVGTVDGLNVIFTPNDGNVKPATTTVSLTVTAATPTLTWTATPEAAQVHETKTFTASSTNTDNAAITYSIISGGDCATINETTGEVTMLKAGTITVQASQAATTNFAAATSITTTCTISKAPTEITTEPQIDGDIVYGAQLTDLKLKEGIGAARNTVNQQAVDGTFAITSGDISTAGEHSITVTFTPANTNMYASCTTTILVTVQKAQPDATASADNITYGQKVNESVLSNSGTDGTWTWAEDEKDKVLAVGTHEGLKVHFTPTDQTNYNEIDGTVSLTVNKAAATLSWTSAPTEADVKDQLTYIATSNHSESAITYAITSGDAATIDATTGVLTIIKAGTITVQASQAATDNYEADNLSITTTLTGEFETVFIGNGDWNDENNWTHGLPTSSNPDVVISGNMTIDESISVGSLTIEANGSVTIVVKGELTVNGESEEREAYGDLFVHNGGNVTIGSEANVKVHDFVIEASIGTQNGTSQSGQVDNGDNVIYTNGAYIDINMDPSGNVDPAQWYGFTVPFQVDAKNGVSRKEGDIFRPCTYGVDYMIAEYDMNQRLSTGKGWKFISDYTLQAGHFYYLTIDGTYNTYRFKAKNDKITIEKQTTLKTNGTGANANWNAVGNTTLTYATISGNDLPNYVQTYINGQSSYQVVHTQDAQFVVGCPFFFQATKDNTTMVLSKPTGTTSAHYAPRQTDRPICVRIAEEGKRFSDQMYITASEDAQGQYQMGRDLAKAGVGTKSAQLWINAYNQQLCVNDAPLVANQAFYDMSLFIPKAGNYEISLPTIPTNGILYLTQDGYPIWNLNDAPFVLELGKGTISEYGLMFEATQAAAPTNVQTISGNDNAQKILKEQSIYIYKNGNIFNVTGQKVK